MATPTFSGRAAAKAARSGISAMQGAQERAQKLMTVTSLAAMSSGEKDPPSRVAAEKDRSPGSSPASPPLLLLSAALSVLSALPALSAAGAL